MQAGTSAGSIGKCGTILAILPSAPKVMVVSTEISGRLDRSTPMIVGAGVDVIDFASLDGRAFSSPTIAAALGDRRYPPIASKPFHWSAWTCSAKAALLSPLQSINSREVGTFGAAFAMHCRIRQRGWEMLDGADRELSIDCIVASMAVAIAGSLIWRILLTARPPQRRSNAREPAA
ncbi:MULTISPECIES: hypothetical protein [unclassified Sphingopyxis]|nr:MULTISPECIES: hypothetical protein [unclassified Sphingopyxis]